MKKTISLKLILVGLFIILGTGLFFALGEPKVAEVTPRDIATGAGVEIIAFGDSLTAGYGLPIGEAYPAQLEAELKNRGLKVSVINSGVSGETTKGNLERAAFIRKQNPDLVLLGIGGNDALRLLPVEETKNNIEKTIQILQAGENPPVVVLLKMLAPINVGLGYKQSFDKLYEELAAKYQILLLPFITAEVFLDKKYKLNDGLHFNQAGYQKIVELYLATPVAEIVSEMTMP